MQRRRPTTAERQRAGEERTTLSFARADQVCADEHKGAFVKNGGLGVAG